ncbi:unnamed protein product [Dovyalis caffra]|uniref:Uncharacterized protein n=1 Tax=Dovyalis caffra TaxID=77055 RepID=A0AAV1SGM7_9ROSI|nr:unnamed protein product [Dovyalis caffra]
MATPKDLGNKGMHSQVSIYKENDIYKAALLQWRMQNMNGGVNGRSKRVWRDHNHHRFPPFTPKEWKKNAVQNIGERVTERSFYIKFAPSQTLPSSTID